MRLTDSEESVIRSSTQVPFCLSVSLGRSYFEFISFVYKNLCFEILNSVVGIDHSCYQVIFTCMLNVLVVLVRV